MEDQNVKPQQQYDDMWRHWEKSHKRGKILGGLFIVIVGSLFLARELGVLIPDWVFSWKMLLIAIGLITGIKHNFRHMSWIVLVLVGGVFLLCDFNPGIAIKPILWPVLVIAFGLFIIFKPRRKFNKHQQWGKWHDKWHDKWQYKQEQYQQYYKQCTEEKATAGSDDYIDSTCFMGGVKKIILSKKFKGGDITNIFGGAEVNLMQADIEGSATLDVTNVFGGTKLIIPAHWEIIQSDLVSVFGSIEDKRPTQSMAAGESGKVLILRGATFFGGIDIKSY